MSHPPHRDLLVAAALAVLLHAGGLVALSAAPSARATTPPDAVLHEVAMVVVAASPDTAPDERRVRAAADPAEIERVAAAPVVPALVRTEGSMPDRSRFAGSAPVALAPTTPVDAEIAGPLPWRATRPAEPSPDPAVTWPIPGMPSAPAPRRRHDPEIDLPPSTAPASASVPGPPLAALGIVRPEPVRNEPPPYPRIARQRGHEGTVYLHVQVLADGTCGMVEIMRSSGYATLDRAAVRATRRWRFRPASENGQPTDMWTEIPVQFNLRDD